MDPIKAGLFTKQRIASMRETIRSFREGLRISLPEPLPKTILGSYEAGRAEWQKQLDALSQLCDQCEAEVDEYLKLAK